MVDINNFLMIRIYAHRKYVLPVCPGDRDEEEPWMPTVSVEFVLIFRPLFAIEGRGGWGGWVAGAWVGIDGVWNRRM